MNNFHRYLTPAEAVKCTNRTLKQLTALANAPEATCENCDEKVWRLGGCGLCFTCATGEADASDDYELKP